MDPDQVAPTGGEAQATTTPVSTPDPVDNRGTQGTTVSTADTPSTPTAAGNGAGQTQPTGTSPAAASQAATAQQWQSARDYARSLGIDTSGANDDATFLRNMFAQAQQAKLLQHHLQTVTSQMGRLNAAPAQPSPSPAQPEAKKWWSPPEWNPAWDSLVTKDEKGQPSLLPGAPAEVLQKYLAYQQYRRDFADRFLSNPEETLKPFVSDMAKQLAQEQIQQHFGQYQEQAHIQRFVAENSSWLHARDANGQTLIHPGTGRPLLSAAGQRFQGYVQQAENQGIKGAVQQESYAKSMLQRDLAFQQLQSLQAQQTGTAAQQQAIQQGNRRPTAGGTIPTNGPNGASHVQNPSLSLRDQMANALRAAGVTDDEINADLAR